MGTCEAQLYNTMTPSYLQMYRGINNNQILPNKKDKNDNSGSKESDEKKRQEEQQKKSTMPYSGELQTAKNPYPEQQNRFPNGEKVSINYSKSEINISQVLTDFRNTSNAIGAKGEVADEVMTYLNLIEHESKKENPNPAIIKSNLKNAAKLLDVYITNTLKKQSSVVESWIDALFLQKIDYHFKDFAVGKISENVEQNPKSTEEQTDKSDIKPEEESKTQTNPIVNLNGVYVPKDKELKKMFIRSKKFASLDNVSKALELFQSTLDYAKEIGDVQTQALVHYETGRIFDKSNEINDALDNYHQAAELSEDNNIKARAHISMAQIYDDYVKFEPAVDHYCAAVSFAGEADNLNLQTKALTDLADIHCEKYDKKNSFMFIELANSVAKETGNKKIIGSTLFKSAKISSKLEENAKALNYYKESTKVYSQTNEVKSEIKNYQNAATIMLKLGNKTKAKALLKRAYSKVAHLNDAALCTELTNRLLKLQNV